MILLHLPVHPRQFGSARLAPRNVLFWQRWTLKSYYFSCYCYAVSTFDNLNQPANPLAWELTEHRAEDFSLTSSHMNFRVTEHPNNSMNIRHSNVRFLWRVKRSERTELQACQEPLSQPANENKDDRASSHTASRLMGGREGSREKQKSGSHMLSLGEILSFR